MILLILGVLLWSIAHLVPALARPMRQALIDKLGSNAYRGLFSVVIVLSIVLMVIGWRSTPETYVYQLPAWSRPIGFLLMIVSFVLFGAANYATAIKRVLRHPMLTGLIFWSISHLITNGTTRALVLFGGLGLWAIIEIPLINAREGAYTAPDSPGLKGELKGLAISAVVFIVVIFLHPYFAGVSPIPG
ncbi:MAG: NnrU family protein [bacterium]